MSVPTIRTIGVVGTGVIGSSWTALFLARGLRVIVSDPAPGAEEKLQGYLDKEWPTLSRIGLSPGASLQNYQFVKSIDEHLPNVDYIQEVGGLLPLSYIAVYTSGTGILTREQKNGPERLDFKRGLFAHLDANTREDVILASSSSGLPSSQFVTDCKKNPGRVLIGHPFNPPHLVPLVEVVPHPETSQSAIEKAINFYKGLKKEPVLVKQETPGFIANRLQAAVCQEAYSLVSRGIISAEDLDKTMTAGPGLRWAIIGPLITNALGGGGDFRHFMEHLGPALKSWKADMDNHPFDAENKEPLIKSVEEYVANSDLSAVQERRDEFILNSLQFNKK